MEQGVILIDRLEISSRIGVTGEERAAPQRLTASFMLFPARPLANLGDDLANTVDYAAVCERVRVHAAGGERRLVETLAEELALLLLAEFPLRAVDIELRKFVVPGARSVGVRLRRETAKG